MSLMDAKLEFDDANTLNTGLTGNRASHSQNVIDLGGATQMPGRGTPLYLNVVVNTGFTNSTSTKLQVTLEDSADNSTWSSKVTFAATAVANLATAGVSIVKAAIPAHDLQRYLRLEYLFNADYGDASDTGKADAWIGLEAGTSPYDTKQYGWDG